MPMDESGFRVCLNYGQSNEIKKYFVYIDLGRFKIVWDLENHIRNTFNIKGDVILLIGDVILPRNESIKVIRPDDILWLEVVEPDSKFSTPNAATELNKIFSGAWSEVPKRNLLLDSPEIPVREVKKNVEKKKNPRIAPYSGIGSFLHMLKSEQKEEPERDMSLVPPSTPESKTKLFESPPVVDLVDDEPISVESEQKRKRKRKHKRKNQEDNSQSDSVNDSKKSETYSPVVQPRVRPKHNKHTFFDNGNDTTSTVNPGPYQVMQYNGAVANGTSEICKSWNNEVEDKVEDKNDSKMWKQSLMSLVNRPAEEKVFKRDDQGSSGGGQEGEDGSSVEDLGPTPPSGKDLDPSMYPVIPSVRPNDVIIFKVLTLGQDYCPIISKHIMGKVKSEDEETGELSILILRGSEEFSQSRGGRLSLGGEDGGGKVNGCRSPHVERLKFKDLIEPRLVFP